MGFENRDYARTDDRSYSSPRSRMSIIGWIITVNIAVFVVQCVWTRALPNEGLAANVPDEMFRHFEQRVSILDEWFSLDPKAILHGQIWRLTTYDFLHARENIWHLVFNMYLLFLTGKRLLDVYTEREFLIFYLLAGVLSGIAYLFWGLAMQDYRPAIGASGAVCAVMVSYAMRWPDDQWTFFFVIPVKAIWLAAITAIMDVYPLLLELGGNAPLSGTAHSAHVGGMLFGYLYARHHWQLEPLFDRFRFSNPLKRRPQLRVVRDTDEPSHPELHPRRSEAQLQLRLDELLAKITEQGQASLTESERNELNEASRYFRERR